MANKERQRVPARYIGHHRIGLHPAMGPYYNTDGTIRANLTLDRNDEIMMPAEEVLGYTLLEDRHGNNNPLYLGVGRVVMPEDVGKSDDELAAIGYRWNIGRQDFIPLIVDNQQSSSLNQQKQQLQQEPMQTNINTIEALPVINHNEVLKIKK
jgi:hypothetical protein